MPHRRIAIVPLVILALFGGARSVAEDEPTEQGPFARGFGYLGAFWVLQSSTELRLFSTDLPLGTRLNVQKDLGIRDSFVVPRVTLGWRFGKRHILSGAYYNLSRSAVKQLETTIELPGDIQFDAGLEVTTDLTLRVGKLQYTYLFHRGEKVSLGIGAGVFIARLGAGLDVTAFAGPIQPTSPAFSEAVTAPLPVVGFRLTYNITPKWGVLASADWFLLSYSSQYTGVLNDTQLYAAHRTFKHVGFAGGLNVQTFNVEFDDDDGLLWQLDSGMVGVLGALTFYF